MFFAQETKLKQPGKIKTDSCADYHIFERNRKDQNGGGLAVGVLKDLQPVWVGEGEGEIETL